MYFIERFYWSIIKVTLFYKALFLWRSWYTFSKRVFGKIFLSLLVWHIFLWEMHSAFIAVGNFSALLSNHFIMPTAFEKQPLCVHFFFQCGHIARSSFSLKCIWSGIFPPGYATHVFVWNLPLDPPIFLVGQIVSLLNSKCKTIYKKYLMVICKMGVLEVYLHFMSLAILSISA